MRKVTTEPRVIITDMDEHSHWVYPTLLADVGGTRLRFGIGTDRHAAPSQVRVLPTADYADLTAAARAYLAAAACHPESAALAIATPADAARAGPIRLTNSNFIIDGAELMARLQLASLAIVNDFEALAWSLPVLAPEDLVVIGTVTPSRNATMAVIGPGTGLGCAGLLRNASGWHAVPGEGGHVTLPGRTAFEREVLAAAADRIGHVSAEKLLSGTGLPLLYQAVATVKKDGAAATGPLPKAREITAAALAGSDSLSREVVDTFCALLGGYAGNIALTFGASGGVLIAGGVATHLAATLAGSEFRSRFEDKGRFAGYLRPVGTALITREQPALDGLVHALGTSLAALPVVRVTSRAGP